jgi:hypothetical protein
MERSLFGRVEAQAWELIFSVGCPAVRCREVLEVEVRLSSFLGKGPKGDMGGGFRARYDLDRKIIYCQCRFLSDGPNRSPDLTFLRSVKPVMKAKVQNFDVSVSLGFGNTAQRPKSAKKSGRGKTRGALRLAPRRPCSSLSLSDRQFATPVAPRDLKISHFRCQEPRPA